MGQKVNPKSLRLLLTKDWDSRWISKNNIAYTLAADHIIRNSVIEKIGKNGIARVVIERNSQEMKIIIFTSRPGIIIGRSGKGILELKQYIEKKFEKYDNFKLINSKVSESKIKDIKKKLINNLKIVIEEIKDPQSSAKLMGLEIGAQLEKRIPYRKAVKKIITKLSSSRNIKGVKINVAGRLGGVDIARSERFTYGSIPLSTIKANVDYAYIPALTTHGIIGVKVWIYKEI